MQLSNELSHLEISGFQEKHPPDLLVVGPTLFLGYPKTRREMLFR